MFIRLKIIDGYLSGAFLFLLGISYKSYLSLPSIFSVHFKCLTGSDIQLNGIFILYTACILKLITGFSFMGLHLASPWI